MPMERNRRVTTLPKMISASIPPDRTATRLSVCTVTSFFDGLFDDRRRN